MNLIIIHKNEGLHEGNGNHLLQFALAHEPLAGVVLGGLSKYYCFNKSNGIFSRRPAKHLSANIIFAVPKEWDIASDAIGYKDRAILQPLFNKSARLINYTDNVQIPSELMNKIEQKSPPESWLVLTNGRFAARINNTLLDGLLSNIPADVLAVNAAPELMSEREKMRITPEGKVAGFRRLYSDTAELTVPGDEWPHHLFVKAHVFKKLLTDYFLPESFSALIEKCRSNSLVFRAVNVGGNVLDLNTENGILMLYKMVLAAAKKSELKIQKPKNIPADSRLIGKVLLGNNVQIGPNVIIVGPAIIGKNVQIEEGVTINSSIIGPEVHVPQNHVVNNAIVQSTPAHQAMSPPYQSVGHEYDTHPLLSTTYRQWPRLSYARCLKRIADCIFAGFVIILFAPLIPFIALAIKLSSPGPVFFIDKRQGLHGKEFNCLKFRTMVAGAEAIQEKLRFVSQVDGPQFKIVNDPRISAVGRFLRDTYIDEIPQFLNVLIGQMSVIGPRPSPEPENTLCPHWREARLSVRPGITGLWQVLRTRVPTKDFQEWIRYDTEYVRNLSLRMDLWICRQTIKKLLEDFMNQF